ncbi:MAG: cytochrome c oxidase subunit II [Trichodesmium sp. St15_bin1_1]|nr:cytochrome c oxidase subunit II [Trichodesmium sp. St15_bin1_1]MDE5119538.1 cytochrome c oxidase subunit II [Trichodesmium sp. St19_bin1]
MKIRTILNLGAIALVLAAISIWVGQVSYSWLPPQAAAESILIDDLFSFLVTLGSFIFLGVTGTLIYSIIFQRAAKYDYSDGPHIEGNITLEVVWTAIPIFLVFWIAAYSYNIYEKMAIQGPMELVHLHTPLEMESAYADPLEPATEPVEEIQVYAKQWSWVFRYPENGVTSTELHLPVDRRVRVALNSEDVLHGFYIPAFRLKQDIIPKHPIDFEFTPIRVGKYSLTDSQYSGTYFATMATNVVVESPQDYKNWLVQAGNSELSPAKNQAHSEYVQKSEAPVQQGWPSIKPASPPIVNYH